MAQMLTDEALGVVASAVHEDHDGLARFTDKLKALDNVPAFWWHDHPVWVSASTATTLTAWPLGYADGDGICLSCPAGLQDFVVLRAAFTDFAQSITGHSLTGAQTDVFLDLATGLTIEQSAQAADVAVSTRRKQLQTVFRKLDVASQAELVSLAGQITARFAAALTALAADTATQWGGYVDHLPQGVRCGVLEGADHAPVRYLEIGPVDGKPVIMLHPMIFPDLQDADVALFHTLGWRTLWPIRAGCLNVDGVVSKDWDSHCEAAADDIYTLQRLCAPRPAPLSLAASLAASFAVPEPKPAPVPVIALVSSGAYATRFAEKYPNCTERLDFVSACFSSGRAKTKDIYFGNFLLRALRQNGRLASVAVQHFATTVLSKERFEPSLRRVFKGSPADQALLDTEFCAPQAGARITFAIRQSVTSMRLDYMSQLKFCWTRARALGVPLQFWHGAQDTVHSLDDLTVFAQEISGKPPQVIAQMGHLTQGAPMRQALRQIAATYSK